MQFHDDRQVLYGKSREKEREGSEAHWRVSLESQEFPLAIVERSHRCIRMHIERVSKVHRVYHPGLMSGLLTVCGRGATAINGK